MKQHRLLSDLIAIEQQLTQLGKGPFLGAELAGGSTWSPAVDIYETPSQFVLTAELPGVQRDEIDVKIIENTLILRGERRWESDVNGEHFHRLESAYGNFERQFTLSETIEIDKITAELQRGVLQLILPKRSPAQRVQQINVATD